MIREKDIERLSPLVREHITLSGRYFFGRTKAVQRGAIRALRNPRDEFGISTCPRVGTKTQGFRSIATRTPSLHATRGTSALWRDGAGECAPKTGQISSKIENRPIGAFQVHELLELDRWTIAD